LFVLTMIILLVAVSTVSAVDEDNSPAVMDDVQLDTVSTQQTQSIATNNVADKNMESSPVATCDREDSITELCDYLLQHKIKYIPVDSYNRESKPTKTVLAFASTRYESKLIDNFVANAKTKYLRQVLR